MCHPQPHYDKYGRRMPPEAPYLPFAGPEGDEGPSFLVQRVYKSMEYPPLFAKKSWTKAALQKDTYDYYKPSETIGTIIFTKFFTTNGISFKIFI